MPRPKRTVRTPLILFGEGPCDELFLGRIHDANSDKLRDKAITKGNGSGGSPGNVLRELEKTILSLGKSSTPALVLIDEDKPYIIQKIIHVAASFRRRLLLLPTIHLSVYSVYSCRGRFSA